jgi:hypothetical protein
MVKTVDMKEIKAATPADVRSITNVSASASYL